ncbi:MAG: CapA family protein [Deltaproteobacteria bacterium]|nr:CapA family protein [Deltaproteobacteria bacterium]
MRPRDALGIVIAMVAGCSDGPEHQAETDREEFVDEEAIGTDRLSSPLAAGPLRFARACSPGERVTIASVGDIMGHEAIQKQAYARGWSSLWGNVTKFLDDANLTTGNLEAPTAYGIAVDGSLAPDPGRVFDNWVYTGSPVANMHRSVATALRNASFDYVSTGNNHALDRGRLGIDRTLDALDAAGLKHSGTVRSWETGPWSARVHRNGSDIHFVSCAFSTNGIADSSDQVLHCLLETDRLVSTVSSLARRSDVAAVIVTPHWGNEYSDTPNEWQRRLARQVLDAGATAVLGHHPHVLQPWEKYLTKDGRETFIIYSLGNFISRHPTLTLARRSSILLYLGLTRGSNGKAFVNGVRYMPLYTRYTDRWNVVAIDDVGGYRSSRDLSTSMYGEWNVRYPWQPVRTTPECKQSSGIAEDSAR